jgi:hypothetical protein
MSAPFEVIHSGGRGLPECRPTRAQSSGAAPGVQMRRSESRHRFDREQEAAQRHQAQIDRERDATENTPEGNLITRWGDAKSALRVLQRMMAIRLVLRW